MFAGKRGDVIAPPAVAIRVAFTPRLASALEMDWAAITAAGQDECLLVECLASAIQGPFDPRPRCPRLHARFPVYR
jgi:hypothetical protein